MKDRDRDEEVADIVEDSSLSLEIQHAIGSGIGLEMEGIVSSSMNSHRLCSS